MKAITVVFLVVFALWVSAEEGRVVILEEDRVHLGYLKQEEGHPAFEVIKFWRTEASPWRVEISYLMQTEDSSRLVEDRMVLDFLALSDKPIPGIPEVFEGVFDQINQSYRFIYPRFRALETKGNYFIEFRSVYFPRPIVIRVVQGFNSDPWR